MPVLSNECREELAGVEARFRALVAEWDLGRSEVAALLETLPDALGLDLVPISHTVASETRMRLLVDIRGGLAPILGAGTRAADWLRQVPEGLVDDYGGPVPPPLAFLSGPTLHIRALRRAIVESRQ